MPRKSIERMPAYLLAGGRSRRFGSDKARATFRATPLIVHLARQLESFGTHVTVVAGEADRYADLGLTTIADVHRGKGPMAGLHTALHHTPQPWLLLCSCDQLECRPHWVTALLAGRAGAARAIAFHAQQWHPFPGLYHRALLPEVERRLKTGPLSLQPLLDAVAVPIDLPVDWPRIAQVNTPDDLAHRERQEHSA